MGRDAAHAHVLLDLAKTRKWNEADPTLKKMGSRGGFVGGNMCRKFHGFSGPYGFLGPQNLGSMRTNFRFFHNFSNQTLNLEPSMCVLCFFFWTLSVIVGTAGCSQIEVKDFVKNHPWLINVGRPETGFFGGYDQLLEVWKPMKIELKAPCSKVVGQAFLGLER